VALPVYADVEKTSLPADFNEPHLKFFMRASAFNKVAIGAGATKKAAKHSAAENLLNKINSLSDDDDDDDDDENSSFQNISNHDFISELLNFCVQKNFHKPTIVEIDSFGPTHAPTYIFECRLDSIACRSSASSKQVARQNAAAAVLDIFKSSYPDIEKKVAVVNEKNNDVEERLRKITTYMDLKKREKTDLMGVTVSQRHNFFLRNVYYEELTKELQKIINEETSDEEKYELLIKVQSQAKIQSMNSFASFILGIKDDVGLQDCPNREQRIDKV
jgi:hypothetical protein